MQISCYLSHHKRENELQDEGDIPDLQTCLLLNWKRYATEIYTTMAF